MKKHLKVILLIISVTFLQIPLSYSNEEESISGISYDEIYDPIEPINRAVLNFNFFIDDIAIRPIVKTYRFTAPEPVEKGVSNSISLIVSLPTIVSSTLESKSLLGSTNSSIVNIASGKSVDCSHWLFMA